MAQLPAILFPSHPLNAFREVDPDFKAEYEAAKLAGFTCYFYDDDSVRDGEYETAIRKTANDTFDPELPVILRGYMLTYIQYSGLYQALMECGMVLVNHPWEYATAHYWNVGYQHFKPYAVESHFWPGKGLTHRQALSVCREGSWYMKDYVKSAKEKGFITNIEDGAEFERVKSDLLEARGKQFYDGICLKQVHQFKPDWQGKPFEVRLFFYAGKLVSAHPTHGTPSGTQVMDSHWLPAIAQGAIKGFGSNFFTVDFGMLPNGEWLMLESGDGGVSGLSPTQKPIWFYQSLMDIVKSNDLAQRIGMRFDFADLYPAPVNLENHRR